MRSFGVRPKTVYFPHDADWTSGSDTRRPRKSMALMVFDMCVGACSSLDDLEDYNKLQDNQKRRDMEEHCGDGFGKIATVTNALRI
mmetsp:Transcript_3640/g.7137  ORF Transcript_3640/g.7137 Transcript_3640/m.7137 type:complete len:86 (+) Transcript_3640:2150-2407(+)